MAFPAGIQRDRVAGHLDRTRAPRRQRVIDHQRCDARAPHIAELLALEGPLPADVDRADLGVVAEGDGDHAGVAILVDRGEPPQPPALEVAELRVAEHAHHVLPPAAEAWRRMESR
jgi:hypothetical protein